jgi:hypothetical protein
VTGPTAAAPGGVPMTGRPVTVNLLGVVEHPELSDSPYRIDADGVPYVPVGDGGIVIGLRLGDPVFGRLGDHAAPGACLVHPDQAARHALTMYSCIGNEVGVRTGSAAGARGAVIGKRGENGRIIACFAPDDLARMRPGDQAVVHSRGQGVRPAWLPAAVTMMNIDPDLVLALPVSVDGDRDDGGLHAAVRLTVPAKLAGNGLGRPAAGWDLDLQLPAAELDGADDRLLFGDLVAVADIDARYNMGYRRGWLTIGIVVHGPSPLPGHGPGITPILTGPAGALRVTQDGAGHAGLTFSLLQLQ